MAKTKPKTKMPIAERAKIFAPFSALKGLSEALAEKEKIREPRRELSDDAAEELNTRLVNLKIGEIATVVYYNADEQQYFQLTGIVTKRDTVHRILCMTEKEICFDDLYNIE